MIIAKLKYRGKLKDRLGETNNLVNWTYLQ